MCKPKMNEPITIMELNDVNVEQKLCIDSTDLDLLKAAGFEDESWEDDECPSFHRNSKYDKEKFYAMYVCTHSKNATNKKIAVVFSWEEDVLNEDGGEYFLDIQEAIIACARHEEKTNKSAEKKTKNLRKYHKLLHELSDNHTEIFLNLQKLHSVWCDIHGLEQMSANEMRSENEHQRKWLSKFSDAWEGMDDIGYLHDYAYNNAGEEL